MMNRSFIYVDDIDFVNDNVGDNIFAIKGKKNGDFLTVFLMFIFLILTFCFALFDK